MIPSPWSHRIRRSLRPARDSRRRVLASSARLSDTLSG